MKYFIDTEFNQNVDPVQLISIGIVADNGREFYAVSKEYDPAKCDDWLNKNVLPVLRLGGVMAPGLHLYDAPLSAIRDGIEQFIDAEDRPEFWGYFAAYDWYLFTRLWGFMTLPKGYPHICWDLRQLAHHMGIPKKAFPKDLEPEHNALIDARWNRLFYDFLQANR